MQVKAMCYNNIVSIGQNLNLIQAVKKMQSHDVERLLILDIRKNRLTFPCGILTYHDIIAKVIATGECLKKVLIADIMAKDFIIIEENEKINVIEKLIEKFKNLIVVGCGNKKVIGMISSNDLIFSITNDLVKFI